MKFSFGTLCLFQSIFRFLPQDTLPPLMPWQGASEALIQPKNPWVTPAELNGLVDSPDYQTTMVYLRKLVESASELRLEVIGKSPQGRDIVLVKASRQPDLVGKSGRPTLLVQAGIHSGEIDGEGRWIDAPARYCAWWIKRLCWITSIYSLFQYSQ